MKKIKYSEIAFGYWDCIHCKTEEQARDLCEFFKYIGLKSNHGKEFSREYTMWDIYKEDTCYYPFDGCHSNAYSKKSYRGKIFEFDEIEFYDKTEENYELGDPFSII